MCLDMHWRTCHVDGLLSNVSSIEMCHVDGLLSKDRDLSPLYLRMQLGLIKYSIWAQLVLNQHKMIIKLLMLLEVLHPHMLSFCNIPHCHYFGGVCFSSDVGEFSILGGPKENINSKVYIMILSTKAPRSRVQMPTREHYR